MKRYEPITVTIEKIVYPGKSLGRGEDGIAVFTDGLLPGETAEIAITKQKKTFREGRVTKIITASPRRITPACPSSGRCGGCSFQQSSYEDQIAMKEGYVRELLGGFGVPLAPVVRSPREWCYRNKMEFSFFAEGGVVKAGLHEKQEFNRFFPVPPCCIADESFLPVAEAVTAFANASGLPVYDKRSNQGFWRHLVMRTGVRTGEMLVSLVTNRAEGVTPATFAPLIRTLEGKVQSLSWAVNSGLSDVARAEELTLLAGREEIEEKLVVGGREYRFAISPFSFFQTNTLGTEKLYEIAIELLGAGAEDTVLDLYCGTGTIGIVISPFVREVIGVEQVASAVQNAAANAARNGRNNASFVAGSVEHWIRHGTVPAFTALVVDPPRGGLSNKVIDFIAKTRPEKLVYVSCNPATLARDLKEIVEKASCRITGIVPVDMFPQTYHIETVVALRKD